MEIKEKIEKLQILFRQRDSIDSQITEILSGEGSVETMTEMKTKQHKKIGRPPKQKVKRHGKGRISEEVVAGVLEDFSNGMKPGELCKKYGISMPTCYRITKGAKKGERKIREYRCLGCGNIFSSNLPKLEAYCPNSGCNKATEIEELKN